MRQELTGRKLRDEAGEFILTVKRREAWWCEGTLEQLFAGRETLAWTDLWKSACFAGCVG